jgi:subfamily B ATP-binding cassette protein MsbA
LYQFKKQNLSQTEKDKNSKEVTDVKFFSVLFRALSYLKPLIGLLLATILFNTIFSVLSTLSIALINPIFGILFNNGNNGNIVKGLNIPSLSNSYQNFYQFIYGFILSESTISTLLNLSIFIIAIFFLKNLFKYFGSIFTSLLEESIVKSIKDHVFSKLLNLGIDFYSKNKQGYLLSIINNDVGAINSTLIVSFTNILRELVQVILSLLLLLSISPKLTMIAFSSSILSLVVVRLSVKYLRKYANRMQTVMADYTTTLQESLSGIRVIKSYSAENVIASKFKNETYKYVKTAFKNSRVFNLIPFINEISAIAALCVVLYIGGQDVIINKSFKGEDLMTFLFALFSIMSPIAGVLKTFSEMQRGVVAGDRVFKLIDTEESIVGGKDSIKEFNSSIVLDEVRFSYNQEREILKGISLEIHKGEKIALVGLSGSGKSTVLDLIIRFYDPLKGSILIDGKNIKNYDIQQYRNLFGVVSQETILFNDSIRNNIKFGRNDITDEKLSEAIEISNAKEFIERNKLGLETFIGDRGITLSGGERQRLAIARAIAKEPEILIFDEATSALDAKNEKEVQLGINKSLENRTAIIVAHRLSTIRDCNRIYVFEEGKIVEVGTHDSLLELGGTYSRLYNLQHKSAK